MMLGNVIHDDEKVLVQVCRRKKIGTIVELVSKTYEIPKQIACPEDGHIMEFETWNDVYRCKNCNATMSATAYIKRQLEKANDNETILSK